MRTGASLALIGVGAILAFAVTANTPVFNLHTAGYVIMIIGAVGLYLRNRGWVSRQILVRRSRSLRGPVFVESQEVPAYVRSDPSNTPPQGFPVFDESAEDRQTVPTFGPGTEVLEEQEYRPD